MMVVMKGEAKVVMKAIMMDQYLVVMMVHQMDVTMVHCLVGLLVRLWELLMAE